MISSLLLLLSSVAAPWFSPSVRIHQERPGHSCLVPAITIGPGAPYCQPIYVAYEDDSLQGLITASADLVFQKSTDAGATWLAEQKIVLHRERGELSPDVTTDPDGNIYVVYAGRDSGPNSGHYYCIRSTDGGVTWSGSVPVDDNAGHLSGLQWARIASDSAGNLFCAWTAFRDGHTHVWSSVSTDQGATWRASVQVSRDTSALGGYSRVDAFVQPGTNQYLAAVIWFHYTSLSVETGYEYGVYLYRSTDGGLSFQPSVRLDTFGDYVSSPHVVADQDHIICDYTGDAGESTREFTESRTFYTGPDTWGNVAIVSDTMFRSYSHGGKLALSPDGRVHTVLMVYDRNWRIHYVFSSDHGASWSGLNLVSDGGSVSQFPDISVDSEGYAYVVWSDLRNHRNEIWFSTNRPVGIAEETSNAELRTSNSSPTVIRRVLFLPEAAGLKLHAPSLLDISGRKVHDLKPGVNDVRALAPGVYFVREEPQVSNPRPQAVRKVVIAD
jgi:hypothetical protein